MSAALDMTGHTFRVNGREFTNTPTINRPNLSYSPVPIETKATVPQTSNSVFYERAAPGTATHNNVVFLSSAGNIVNVADARMLLKESLQTKLSRISEQMNNEEYEVDPGLAEEITITLRNVIDLMPLQLNFPYPVLLEEGVSLCWDEGDAYAELALDFSGKVGLYAKDHNGGESFLDMSLADYARQGEVIMESLKSILV